MKKLSKKARAKLQAMANETRDAPNTAPPHRPPCPNCPNNSGEVSISIPCPICRGEWALMLHDCAEDMYRLLNEWAEMLYWTAQEKRNILIYKTGRLLGKLRGKP